MMKVLLLLFLVIILLFTTLKRTETFQSTSSGNETTSSGNKTTTSGNGTTTSGNGTTSSGTETKDACDKYTEEECPEIECVFENNRCLKTPLTNDYSTNNSVKKNYEYSKKIVCETIEDPNDCINYGCNYKSYKVECKDNNKELTNCPIRRFDPEKLGDMLDVKHKDGNKYPISENNLTFYPKFLLTVKPKKSITHYFKIENEENINIFYLSYKNDSDVDNYKIDNLNEFKIPSLWDDKSDDIVKQIDNSYNIHILLIYEIENDFYFDIKLEKIVNLRTEDNKYINQLYSFKNCYKNGGKEVNEIPSNQDDEVTLVKCNIDGTNITNNNDYSFIKKCINPNNNGCLHFDNKKACLDDNYDLKLKRNRCRWIKNLENDIEYCYDNIYDSDSTYDDHKCLKIKDRYSCNANQHCKYRDNLKKCVDSKLCKDYTNENDCNNDELCMYTQIAGYKKCIKKPTIRNLYNFKTNNQQELTNKINSIINSTTPIFGDDDYYKLFADKDAMIINKYFRDLN